MSGYVLEIVEGPEAGKQFPVGESVEIGRESGVGIELANDKLVSRRHARLTLRAEGVVVEDLGSRNGTFLNGNEIYSSTVLEAGSELMVGVTVLELRTRAQASGATVVRPVPAGLTSMRPAPAARQPIQAEHAMPSGLAVPERSPDYVPPRVAGSAGDSPLSPLLDIHTKRMARTAPLAIFVLVAFVVIIALALR